MDNKDLPVGIVYNKNILKYGASIDINRVNIHLGFFDDIWEAELEYLKAKYDNLVGIIKNSQIPESLHTPFKECAEEILEQIEIIEGSNNVEHKEETQENWEEEIWMRNETITNGDYDD